MPNFRWKKEYNKKKNQKTKKVSYLKLATDSKKDDRKQLNSTFQLKKEPYVKLKDRKNRSRSPAKHRYEKLK